MTQKILLALALSFGAAHFAVPTAQACGGYGSVDPRESAVREAVVAHAQRRAPEGVSIGTLTLSITDDRATALVHFWRGNEHLASHDVQLAFRGDRWRVVRFQPRA